MDALTRTAVGYLLIWLLFICLGFSLHLLGLETIAGRIVLAVITVAGISIVIAISPHSVDPTAQDPSITQQTNVDEKASKHDEECLICKDNKRIYTLIACGHVVACGDCKEQLKQSPCPLCNKQNSGWLRVYY